MNRPRHISWILLLSVALFSPLAVSFGQEVNVDRVSEDWMHVESRPGLRQEGKPVPVVGELLYRSKPMPAEISREGVLVTVDIGTFRYGEREDLESSGGWLLENETTTTAAKSATSAVTSGELTSGFYPAVFHEKKSETPDSWVFVEVPGQTGSLYWTTTHKAFWAAPAALEHLPLE